MLMLWICVHYIRCCDIVYTMLYYIVYTMLKVGIVGFFFLFVRYEQKWFFHFHIITANFFFFHAGEMPKIFFEILLEIQSNIGKEIVILKMFSPIQK